MRDSKGASSDEVVRSLKVHVHELGDIMNKEGIGLDLRLETTGGLSQIGTIEEILEVSCVYPCIDFSHLYARSLGACHTHEDFLKVVEKVQEKLGAKALESLHMHISGIEYGTRGEKKHVALKDSFFDFESVLSALVEKQVGGYLLCESPALEEDALLLKETYERLCS